MIWSIIPEDIIFSQNDNNTDLIQQKYLGRQVLVRRIDASKSQIAYVISSNPADFLDERIAPGSIIEN